MKQYTSPMAKSLITVIGTEYALGMSRVERGYINEDRMLGTVLERLNRLSIDFPDLRLFLDRAAHIPEVEDESMDEKRFPWSKEPREPRDNDVLGLRENGTRERSPTACFGNNGNKLTRVFSG